MLLFIRTFHLQVFLGFKALKQRLGYAKRRIGGLRNNLKQLGIFITCRNLEVRVFLFFCCLHPRNGWERLIWKAFSLGWAAQLLATESIRRNFCLHAWFFEPKLDQNEVKTLNNFNLVYYSVLSETFMRILWSVLTPLPSTQSIFSARSDTLMVQGQTWAAEVLIYFKGLILVPCLYITTFVCFVTLVASRWRIKLA